MARVGDFFFFLFSKESKSEKKFFLRGEGKGGLASVSEIVLQRLQI